MKIVRPSRRELNFRRSQGVDSEPNCVRSVIKILLKNKHQKYLEIPHFGVPVGRHFGIILEPWMPHGTPGAPDGHLGSIFDPWGPPLGPLWGPLGFFGCSFGGLWVSFGHLLAPFWTPRDTFRDLQWRFGVPLLTLMFFLKPRLPLWIFAFALASNFTLDPRMLLGSFGVQLHARLSSFQCVLIYINCPVCLLV